MKKRLLLLLLVVLVSVACEKAPSVEPPVSRTVLLYIAGENLTTSWIDKNIADLKQGMVGISSNMLVYKDERGSTGEGLPVLFKVESDGSQTIIEQYPEENSASVSVISRVVNKVLMEYPADSYGLILSSHGLGWVPKTEELRAVRSVGRPESVESGLWQVDPAQPRLTKYFGIDGYGEDSRLDIADLATAFPSNRMFDFLIFDACFMASVEALYDLRHVAKYVISSPAEVMGDGFPYADIAPLLFEPTVPLEKVCRQFMNYYRTTATSYQSGTISLVKSDELEALAAASRLVFASSPNVISNTSAIQSYESLSTHVFYDLNDYVNVSATSPTAYQAFKTQLARTVLFADHTPTVWSDFGGSFPVATDHYSGLSVFIPQPRFPIYSTAYRTTAWGQVVGN